MNPGQSIAIFGRLAQVPQRPKVLSLVVAPGERPVREGEPPVPATPQDQLVEALRQAREEIARLTMAFQAKEQAIDELTRLATTDELTRLCNRRHFLERLESKYTLAVRHGEPLSMVMLDVDHFKSYNDTFGHAAGDHVLRVIAEILGRVARADDVAARYGGEEFAVLLPETDDAGARTFAERVRGELEAYGWTLRPVRVSLGVSTLGPTTPDADGFVEEADQALYHAKKNGRDRVTHYHDLFAAREDRCPPMPADGPAVRGESPSARDDDSREVPRPAAMPDEAYVDMPTCRETAWDVMDRLLKEIKDEKGESEHVPVALGAICDATGADVAFLYSSTSREVAEIVSGLEVAPQWCKEMAQRLLIDHPEGGIARRSDLILRRDRSQGPVPESIAVAPVDDQRDTWVIAVSYNKARPLQLPDLKLISVIWQLQLEYVRHASVQDHLRETLFGVVRCLSTAIDAKDPYTCGHSERVARISVRLGQEMGLSRGEVSDLYLAGLLHDVGKIGIRDEVLLKSGPLAKDEYTHMKEHPITGDRIVSKIKRLSYLCAGVRSHHERYDGAGYPDGLAGESIPLMARIIAVADSCDAMMCARRYRPALSPAKIEAIFREGAGTQWDPVVVEHFMACRQELYSVCQRGLGQSVYMAVERAAGHDVQVGRNQSHNGPDSHHPSGGSTTDRLAWASGSAG